MRYSFGGDEFLFVEISEAMALESFFKSLALTNAIKAKNITGVLEICPSNASYQVRYNPDIIAPDKMLATLQQIEKETHTEHLKLHTRIIEIPVLYADPWTLETQKRFRERHQDPNSTDLDYAARINNFENAEAFIAAHAGSPWFVSMVGFVAGLPFMYQMVAREKQLEVPKYLRPRTDTPKLTIGHGGCFACIYSVRGAGGYQMFGVTPAPIFEPSQSLPYLKKSMVLFLPGDIVKFRAVDRTEYDSMIKQVEAGTFDLKIKEVDFALDQFLANPVSYNKTIVNALYC